MSRAVMQQALEALDSVQPQNMGPLVSLAKRVLRAALAQQDEPAAWMHADGRVVTAATMTSARRDGGAMLSSLSGYTTPLYAAPQPAPVAPMPEQPSDEQVAALAEEIAGHLCGTYICGRVWGAWQAGTMSEYDFIPADESDLPHDIARAVLAQRPELLNLADKSVQKRLAAQWGFAPAPQPLTDEQARDVIKQWRSQDMSIHMDLVRMTERALLGGDK